MSFKPTRVPKFIDDSLKRACVKVADSDQAFYVDITPAIGCRENKCAWNVRQEAQKSNGEIVFGWAVYEWEGVMYDFIGHAVLKIEDQFLCVTPSKYEESKLVFVPDRRINFDFSNEDSRLPSVEVAISKSKVVDDFLNAQKEIREIKLKYPVTSKNITLSLEDSTKMRTLQKIHQSSLERVIYHHHPIKESCPCCSGKQFRKCCRPHMQKVFGS